MADTLQAVLWSLERKCIFRTGDDWFLPVSAWRQLRDLKTISEAQTLERIVDGICVTGVTMSCDESGRGHLMPVSGFRIVDRIGQHGDLAKVLSTCKECEANAKDKFGSEVAGCLGHLSVWPYSAELDERLWEIIRQRNLESRLREAFPVTRPLWFGFWINSPLRQPQTTLLHELLGAARGQDRKLDRDLVHFLNGLKIAMDWGLPVHVSIGPPGHTDFGYNTTFPHCPRCKAEAEVERWKAEYPNDPLECQACGCVFNPNEHHRSQPDEDRWGGDSLERMLGKDRYEPFVKRFLLHRSKTEEQAEQALDHMNNGPLLRRIAEVRRKRSATMQNLRIKQQHVPTAGFGPTVSVPLEDDVALDLVLVPAGAFLMGSPDSCRGWDERPQHVVRFQRPFYMGRFPITQRQWAVVMGDNPSWYTSSPDLPVDRVSWFDCQEFCDQLSQRLGRVVRLPSEAEWEYACRAGTTTNFAFGDTLSPDQANFVPSEDHPYSQEWHSAHSENADRLQEMWQEACKRQARTTPVGSYPPNAWGFHDMHGNVNEWCEDAGHDSYRGSERWQCVARRRRNTTISCSSRRLLLRH